MGIFACSSGWFYCEWVSISQLRFSTQLPISCTMKIVTVDRGHNHLQSFGNNVATNASRPKVHGFLFKYPGQVSTPGLVQVKISHYPANRVLTVRPTSVNNCFAIVFQECHFSNRANALCKFSIAVLTSSYCKALAAKRQNFWAFSLSSGDNALLGWVGTTAAITVGWEAAAAAGGCNIIKWGVSLALINHYLQLPRVHPSSTHSGVAQYKPCQQFYPNHMRGRVRVKFAYEPSSSSGWSLSRFQKHEATRNISTPTWMGCYTIALALKICRYPFINLGGERHCNS